MIEVFKTNVESRQQSEMILRELGYHFPGSDSNFDLEDCDRILRVVGHNISSEGVIDVLRRNGCHAEVLG
jgi:hypothetical protein